MLNRACGLYGNIPKMNTKNSGTMCENTEKRCRKSPQGHFSPLEKELPEKNRNNFSFRFFASLFCVHHDSFFTIKIYFNYASCSFSQKIMLF